MSKPILHIDMDDTMNDYSRYHKYMLSQNPKNKFPQSEYGFFLKIPPIINIKSWITSLSNHFDVWILTRPSYKNPLCYTEKRVWIEQHLGYEWCEKLIICPNKALVKGDFLVDDFLWEDFEGEQIQFGTDEFPTWNVVYDYLLTKI
jgi:5'(3')-deoxyribonucleotidase